MPIRQSLKGRLGVCLSNTEGCLGAGCSLCAYTHHAEVLGQTDPRIDTFVAEAYAFLCSQEVG